MGIKFACPHCGKSLNVKSNLAGRRGLCPHCRGRVDIPTTAVAEEPIPVAQAIAVAEAAATTAPVTRVVPSSRARTGVDQNVKAFEDLDPNSFLLERPQVALEPQQPTPFDWIADAPDAVWYVRNRSGGQYGPAVGDMMRAWLQEGRVSRECYVWREGWANWRQASDVFPHWLEPRANGMPPDQSPRLALAPALALAPWHPNPQVHKAISEARSSGNSQAAGQSQVPGNLVGARTAEERSAPTSRTSPATAHGSSKTSSSPTSLLDTDLSLDPGARRNNATWLFVAILVFVMALSGVAITTVVFMIKKANDIKLPDAEEPAVPIRDPFS
jgi:hypothetical protein